MQLYIRIFKRRYPGHSAGDLALILNAKDRLGQKVPLHYAVANNKRQLLEALIAEGADPAAVDA